MLAQSSLRALFLLVLTFWFGISHPACAQQSSRFNQITEVIEDSRGRQVVLNTSSKRPLPAPRFKYLTGSFGETILVADFPGVVWYGASRLIYRVPDGVNHIRIGQFQANPPILRIAITARDPGQLKQIDFSNSAGSLVLKWSGKALAARPVRSTRNENPKPAPRRISKKQTPVRAAIPATGGKEPEHAPPRTAWAESKNTKPAEAPQIARRPSAEFSPAPTSVKRRDKMQPTRLDRPDRKTDRPEQLVDTEKFQVSAIPQDLPAVTVGRLRAGAKAIEVQLVNGDELTYHSFRLRQPERHVIDFDGLPELADGQIPALATNPFVTAVRAGHPGGDETKSRLVLDLTNKDVFVQESLSDDGRKLLLTIDNTGAGVTDIRVPKGMVVVIDPGHGGSDPGAERGSIQEKELTLMLAKRLRRILKKSGVKALLTRSDDTFVSLEDRVLITNSKQPDAFISIHINALETKSNIHGIETYYQTPQSKKLADAIHNALVNGLDAPDRNVRKRRFYVINHTPIPAVLAEVGFISHTKERKKLISSEYQNKVATGLARGVMLYLSEDGKRIARGR